MCNSAGSLAAENLASFQGPALLAYNDGKAFSEEDYASISSLGNSVKKDQKGKTGRFGVGFNAAYHLTDLPSFISGRPFLLRSLHLFNPCLHTSEPSELLLPLNGSSDYSCHCYHMLKRLHVPVVATSM